MNDAIIFDLSDEIVNESISLRKRYKIKLPGVIIAATAITFKLPIITRNSKDFSNIKGLKTTNPWEINSL
jgi:predicted nucleic acid-binding protein